MDLVAVADGGEVGGFAEDFHGLHEAGGGATGTAKEISCFECFH